MSSNPKFTDENIRLFLIRISTCVIWIVFILFLVSCGNALKEPSSIQGTRIEVHQSYLRIYGNDPIRWNDDVKKQYNIDMDKASVN
jgi:hypothetical protein